MSHLSEPMPDFNIVKRAIMVRHLEQLRGLDLRVVEDPLENLPTLSKFDELVQWTKDSKAQIAAGQADRVYGGRIGSPINFNNAFMALLESAAMYLRDTSKVVEAVNKYISGEDKLEEALLLLESSTNQIETIANMWGMHFIQICDFIKRHPDGHIFLVGPFCGAFIPKDFGSSSPYIGVAFKGTSVTREILNDLIAMTTVRANGLLWGSQVSSGFYYPLFSKYSQSPMPFVMIRQAVQDISAKGKTTAITHVTGHSLGGAYSVLTYGQLCIEGFGTSKATLGDLYTFGCPRVGRDDFAKAFKAAVSPPASDGSSWRIVNNKDYVPKVPASLPWTRDSFTHVDSGYRIYPNAKPMPIPSEIGTHPTWSIPTAISPHYVKEYYRSLKYATTHKVQAHALASLGRDSLAVSTYSGFIDTSLSLDDVASPVIKMESIEDFTVGTIRFHHFFGEFTAYGVVQNKLNSNPKFYYNKSVSLKSLYTKENYCIFSNEDNTTLKISFIVDGKYLAAAYVSTAMDDDIDDVALTRGSCVWTFYEDKVVDEVEASIMESADKLFSIPDETAM